MRSFYLLLLAAFIFSCGEKAQSQQTSEAEPDESVIIDVLDKWHMAASNADFDTYFGYFADDSSIFMGTDATERWTVPEFKAYAKPHFDAGAAWDFTGRNRHIYFSEDGKVAWFDEELDTPNLGPSRGTGVLVLSEGEWKIAHYNLTVPIPNEIVGDVVKRIEGMGAKDQDKD